MAKKLSIQHTHQIKYFTKESKKYQTKKIDPWQKSYNSRIGKMINKNKKAIAADIGAGSGYVTIYLATKVKKVYAFDLTPSYVKLIQKKAKDLNLNNVIAQVSAAENLPLKDNSVDFIVANAILEHIEAEEKTIN